MPNVGHICTGLGQMIEAADDVVVDVEMLATLFAGLHDSPDLFHALQFVTLAEAAVLRDSLIVVSIEDGSGQDTVERASERALVEQFMSPLIAEGAVRFEEIKVRQNGGDADYLDHISSNATEIAAEDNVMANVAVMAGRSLTAERIRSKPALTLPMQQTFYEMSANVRADHSVCDLSGRYRSLAEALTELRRQARVEQSRYQIVPLPPIGLEVFRAASTIDQLSNTIVEVRDRFSDLRTRLRNLQEVLDDPSVALDRKLKLRTKWMNAWKSLSSKYEFTGAVSLANTNSAIYKLAPQLPGAMALNPSSWINLLTRTVEEWPELWSRWRMRALHRTLRSYVESPDRALGESVEKIIRRPITDDEIRDITDVQEMMSKLSESAVAIYRAEESA